jgi:hypothetical protein
MSEESNLKLSKADELEQFKMIYDYIKFHIGLYLATPPVIAIIAESFNVKTSNWFRIGLGAMIVIYLASGINAGQFMARHVNDEWNARFLEEFKAEAFSPNRRFMHHTLYWIGLAVGLFGLAVALVL